MASAAPAAEPGRDARDDAAPCRRASAADVLGLVLLLPAFVAVMALAPPVFTRGEAREGLVVQTMLAGHDWIVPRREGRIASKPPFFHWIAAGAGAIAGPSDRTLRFPSALAAWATTAATFALGLVLFDRRRAWLAALALVSTPGFWRPAIEARVDMAFAATITIALAGVATWWRTGSPLARWVASLAGAAAVLTKGPAGAVLIAGVALAGLWRRGDGARLRALLASVPAAVAAIVVGGWYAVAYRRGGAEFVAVQIVHENVARAIGFGSFARQRRSHPLKLVFAFVTWLLPWNLALLGAWRRPATWQSRLLHAWWIVTLATFTVAAGKRSVYLLPLYPAIALLAADRLDGLVARRPWIPAAMGVLALLLAGTTIAGMRHEHARSRLRAFVARVDAAVPADAAVAARGTVSENDRLVLAYRLRRAVPRLPADAPPPAWLVVPRGRGATLAPACAVRVAWGSDGEGPDLLACPPGSPADERR